MLSSNIVTAIYIAASVLFILSLGGLSNQEKAKVRTKTARQVRKKKHGM